MSLNKAFGALVLTYIGSAVTFSVFPRFSPLSGYVEIVLALAFWTIVISKFYGILRHNHPDRTFHGITARRSLIYSAISLSLGLVWPFVSSRLSRFNSTESFLVSFVPFLALLLIGATFAGVTVYIEAQSRD